MSPKRAAAAGSRVVSGCACFACSRNARVTVVGVGIRLDAEQRVEVDLRPVADASAARHALGTLAATRVKSVVLERDRVGRHVHRRLVLGAVDHATLAPVLRRAAPRCRPGTVRGTASAPPRRTAGTAAARPGTAAGSKWMALRSAGIGVILARRLQHAGDAGAHQRTDAGEDRGNDHERPPILGPGPDLRRSFADVEERDVHRERDTPITRPTIAPIPPAPNPSIGRA